MAKDQKPWKDIIEENGGAVIRYHRGLQFIRSEYEPLRDFQTECVVYWGPTGSGKSFHVKELIEGQRAFI